jgi:hypothetical protein
MKLIPIHYEPIQRKPFLGFCTVSVPRETTQHFSACFPTIWFPASCRLGLFGSPGDWMPPRVDNAAPGLLDDFLVGKH